MNMNTAEKLKAVKTLGELVSGLVPDDVLQRWGAIPVSGVQLDSRLLRAGDLFLACFGRNHDARDYIQGAVEDGVAAVLAQAGGEWVESYVLGQTPVIVVDALPARLSEIASRFYDLPSERLSVIGITGTNGKTSCSQFIAEALTGLGRRCGTMGTLGYGIYGEWKETGLTTPDAVFTQRALAEMADRQIDPVVMEVSSVGLHQKRVEAVRFHTAVFTNLSRDHLDYHGSMENYAANKRRLFEFDELRNAVINLDDHYALSMVNAIAKSVEIFTYSVKNPIATVYSENLTLDDSGYSATICSPYGSASISGRLLGSFNFSNLLAVIATLVSYESDNEGFDMQRICQQAARLSPVNGRMELVGEAADVTAVVDYAHTPEGLRQALLALREHFEGRIHCVFGCGGNRDSGKRPLMGEIAEQYADLVTLTDDNPRNESGDEIIRHILNGIGTKQKVIVERDRGLAIDAAIAAADPGDVVLVAGKGHESYQDVGGVRSMFSDVARVRLALQARTGRIDSGSKKEIS